MGLFFSKALWERWVWIQQAPEHPNGRKGLFLVFDSLFLIDNVCRAGNDAFAEPKSAQVGLARTAGRGESELPAGKGKELR